MIRAIPANFDKQSAITAGLSDLLFIWGNRFEKLEGKFPATLQWANLITTSEKSWSLDWKGGWIPQEVLDGGKYFNRKQPLAVLIKGNFSPTEETSQDDQKLKSAQLLLIGNSEMFKNTHLLNKEFKHQDLILNAVLALTYGNDLARAHSGSGEAKPGFGYVEPGTKLLFRLGTVFLFPVIYCFYGFYRRLICNRPLKIA